MRSSRRSIAPPQPELRLNGEIEKIASSSPAGMPAGVPGNAVATLQDCRDRMRMVRSRKSCLEPCAARAAKA
jgi:hypothetical protein